MTDRRYPAPTLSVLRSLAERDGPVLSLFVPVTASVPDVAQNPVRHARAVSTGLARWRELGADASQLEKAEIALEEFARESAAPAASVALRAAFWSADAGLRVLGLADFAEEAVCVATGPRLRPIARAANRPARYRVLTVSAKRVALFEGSEDALEAVPTGTLPASLEEVLGSELTDPSLQYHSGGRSGAHPVYHGQGGAPRGRRVDLERFHQRIARALEAAIANDPVPLVLAADSRHGPGLEQALARDVGLISDRLDGNADHLSASALHAATWPLASGNGDRPREGLERARQSGAPLVTKLSELVSQAVMGRIARLWVPETGCIPGRVDRTRGCAVEGWGDDDLIDSLVVEVLRRAGDVEVVDGAEFPADVECLAAELR